MLLLILLLLVMSSVGFVVLSSAEVLMCVLQLERVGPSHQAGSDSLLTAATFFQLRNDFFPEGIDPCTRGVLYNLGQGVPVSDDQQGAGVPGQ